MHLFSKPSEIWVIPLKCKAEDLAVTIMQGKSSQKALDIISNLFVGEIKPNEP